MKNSVSSFLKFTVSKFIVSFAAFSSLPLMAFSSLSCSRSELPQGQARVNPDPKFYLQQTMLSALEANETTSLFLNALRVCALDTSLEDGSAKSVFAPTNTAWKKWAGSAPSLNFCNEETNLRVRHFLSAKLYARDTLPQALEMMSGEKVFTRYNRGTLVSIDAGVSFVGAEEVTGTGALHIIDIMLIPDSLGRLDAAVEKRPYLTELVDTVQKYKFEGLARKQDGVTLLAPHNVAIQQFGPLPGLLGIPGFMLGHVVPEVVELSKLDAYPKSLRVMNRGSLTISQITDPEGNPKIVVSPQDDLTLTVGISETVLATNGRLYVLDGVLAKSN
jgi:uncharacterized surface protein with fasciclin (FAS1) repeats